jgi:hypothetical protein
MKTNTLIVIGGPSCVGKTTLIKNLRQGRLTHICRVLGINNPSRYTYVDACKLLTLNASFVDRLVLHYDFFEQYFPDKKFRYMEEMLFQSGDICVLTLCVPGRILSKRCALRVLRRSPSLLPIGRNYKQKLHDIRWLFFKEQAFRKNGTLIDLYAKWFDFINSFSGINHWIIDTSRRISLIPCPYGKERAALMLRESKCDSQN